MIDWNHLINRCHAAAVVKGRWDKLRPIEETLMDIVTEVAMAVKWYRNWKGGADEVFKPYRYDPGADCDILESTCPHMYVDAQPYYWLAWKPTGVPSRLADVAMRVCDLLGYMGFDGGPSCFDRWCEVDKLGGFVADCSTLAFFALDVTKHEESTVGIRLVRVLIATEQLAARYNINLAAAVETQLVYNERCGHRHVEDMA